MTDNRLGLLLSGVLARFTTITQCDQIKDVLESIGILGWTIHGFVRCWQTIWGSEEITFQGLHVLLYIQKKKMQNPSLFYFFWP